MDRHPPGAYAFGDSDLAADRLAVVQEVFAPSSRALLARALSRPPALAYDLGCGPGHTTAMVARATGAARTIGLDSSDAHLSRAATAASGPVEFASWDVRRVPFPAGPADLIYCRLLLAHLPEPAATVRAWATQLTGDGLIVLDEIEWIRTGHPVLAAHLKLAGDLVASAGARMCAGPDLAGLAAAPDLRPAGRQITEVPVPTALAASMFAMNVAAWGDRPVTLGLCDAAELLDLADGLAGLAGSAATGEITWGLHQAAYGAAPC
jgi:SAM-dependent methyltransferase